MKRFLTRPIRSVPLRLAVVIVVFLALIILGSQALVTACRCGCFPWMFTHER